jgi:hypothetical protein
VSQKPFSRALTACRAGRLFLRTVSVIGTLLLYLGGASAAQAALRVADSAPHAALWRRLYDRMPDFWRIERAVIVQEVSRAEMERLVERAGGNRGGHAHDHSVVDGCYQPDREDENGPATITLRETLQGEEAALVFTHEYGHLVWDARLSESQRACYRRLWHAQSRAHHLVTRYAGDSQEEGFAEAFAYFLQNPAALQRRDPRSWQFLHDLSTRARLSKASPEDRDTP